MTRIRQNIYLSECVLAECETEARRLDRSVNWVVTRCVLKALVKVREMPGGEEERRETA